MASIPRQLPQQVSDLTSPPVGQRQGSRISRPWYDWALWVSQQITGLLDGDGVVIPPGTITFTQTDVVLGRKSPGAGVGEEITFTDQAQQLADDTSFAQMRATLGIDASTTPYTPSDVGYWGGADPGEVDDALNYLALNGVHVPTTLAADEKFLVPTDRQCLYAATITVDGTLTVDGDLIEVVTEQVQVQGTANEVEVSQSGLVYTVGLPDDVTITSDLTVGETIRVNANGSATATAIGRAAGNGFFFGSNTLSIATNSVQRVFFDNAGRQINNHSAGVSLAGVNAGLQFNNTSSANGLASMSGARWSNDASGPQITLAKSRSTTVGTAGSAVASSDQLGLFVFAGDDGTDMATIAARLVVTVSNTVASDIIPTSFSFETMNAAGSRLTGLTVNDSQQTLRAVGTVSLPSNSYITDADTGSYRIGANNEGFSAGGTLQFEYSANGFFTRRANHGAAVTLTTSTTLDASHETVWVDATSGAITITVPAASGRQYRKYNIYKVDSSANVVTVARSGSDSVMFVTSFALNAQGEGLNIQSDGSANWYPYA